MEAEDLAQILASVEFNIKHLAPERQLHIASGVPLDESRLDMAPITPNGHDHYQDGLNSWNRYLENGKAIDLIRAHASLLAYSSALNEVWHKAQNDYENRSEGHRNANLAPQVIKAKEIESIVFEALGATFRRSKSHWAKLAETYLKDHFKYEGLGYEGIRKDWIPKYMNRKE